MKSKVEYAERLERARSTKSGDIWLNNRTGRSAKVIGRFRSGDVELLHESGRKTTKQYHYLAGDYELLPPAPKDPHLFTWKSFKQYIENQGVRESDPIEFIEYNGRDDTAPYVYLPKGDDEDGVIIRSW